MRKRWMIMGVLFPCAMASCGDETSSNGGAGGADAGLGGAGQDASTGGTTAAGGIGGDGGAAGATSGTGGGTGGGTSGGTGGGTSGGSGGGTSGAAGSGVGPDGLFPADHVFYKDVSGLQPAADSQAIIDTLESLGGWGNGNTFQITFSFDVFEADSATPTAVPDAVVYDTHSDTGPFPVVPGGALEDMDDYYCPGDIGDSDCHYLVVQQDARLLFEVYAASELSPGHWRAGSMAKWYLDSHYGDNQRGFGCTSADAAGLPILPGLLRVKDVVTDGEIKHALRFILPNTRMRYRSLVPPASHFGAPSSNEPHAPPYGVRLRLKSSFDETAVASTGGRVIVRALKKYGMILADGGQIALTAERDRFTAEKWDGVLTAQDLSMLDVADFDVVDLGTVQSFTEYPDCALQNPP